MKLTQEHKDIMKKAIAIGSFLVALAIPACAGITDLFPSGSTGSNLGMVWTVPAAESVRSPAAEPVFVKTSTTIMNAPVNTLAWGGSTWDLMPPAPVVNAPVELVPTSYSTVAWTGLSPNPVVPAPTFQQITMEFKTSVDAGICNPLNTRECPPVPEPNTWIMLLAGLLIMTGVALKRAGSLQIR